MNSKYISSHHCSIEMDEESGEIVLFDSDSKNGVYDGNGNMVEEIVMEKGVDFYLAKCVHLRWTEFEAFTQIGDEDIPVLKSFKKKEPVSEKKEKIPL